MQSVTNSDKLSPIRINNNNVSTKTSLIQCNDERKYHNNSDYHGNVSYQQYDVYPISFTNRKYSNFPSHENRQSDNMSCTSFSSVEEKHSALKSLDNNCDNFPLQQQQEKTTPDMQEFTIADNPSLYNAGNPEIFHTPESSYLQNDHWGDSLMPKSDNTLRLYFQNINGLKPNNCWDK